MKRMSILEALPLSGVKLLFAVLKVNKNELEMKHSMVFAVILTSVS